MDLVARLLSKGLRSRNPQLDLGGADRRVLCIAYQDFMNYLKVHWRLTGEETSRSEVREKICSYFYEKPWELEEFVCLWSGIWMKKWEKRVKLIVGKDPRYWKRTDALLSKAEPLWRRLKHRKEVKDLVIEALIRNGEICGTSILAEDMLKMELGSRIKRKMYVEGREGLLDIVNSVLRKVRKISRSEGPLIMIKIDKRFFDLLQEAPEET